MFLSQDKATITSRLEEIEREKLKLEKQKEELENRIKYGAELAKLSILSQGGVESRDFWRARSTV